MNTSLIDILRLRSEPLEITVDEYGCIAAANYDFGGPYSVGIVFVHSEGDIAIGADPPTRADYRWLNDAAFEALDFPGKKQAVMEAFGFEEDADCPWVELNAEGGIVLATDIEPRMLAWLAEPVELSDDLGWVPHSLSQYLPGFEIMAALPVAKQQRLGLREVDIGGMGSGGCWAVEVKASPEVLDAALMTAGLPFRLSRKTSRLPTKPL